MGRKRTASAVCTTQRNWRGNRLGAQRVIVPSTCYFLTQLRPEATQAPDRGNVPGQAFVETQLRHHDWPQTAIQTANVRLSVLPIIPPIAVNHRNRTAAILTDISGITYAGIGM